MMVEVPKRAKMLLEEARRRRISQGRNFSGITGLNKRHQADSQSYTILYWPI